MCSDIRFPEIFRAYALAGAELVILPAAFLSPRFDHWDWLVGSRAADHQVFLAGPLAWLARSGPPASPSSAVR
ncbi:MAG: hypothetical protein GDA41_08380 [Rhodospirillales bacterium]|nr:hypothetical protein [Rhodospirillales bacterium]